MYHIWVLSCVDAIFVGEEFGWGSFLNVCWVSFKFPKDEISHRERSFFHTAEVSGRC